MNDWLTDEQWDDVFVEGDTRTAVVCDPELGTLVEVTDADGNRFYGTDVPRCYGTGADR